MKADSISNKKTGCRDDTDAHAKFADAVSALAKKCGIEGYALHSLYVRKGMTRVELDKLFVTLDKMHEDIKKEMTVEFNKNRGR